MVLIVLTVLISLIIVETAYTAAVYSDCRQIPVELARKHPHNDDEQRAYEH